jgi:4-hydroxy-tetrahydrodipicolinate synthase
MVTPFGSALEVDLERAGELASMLVEEGSDGLVVAGTTGESPTLTGAEKLQLLSRVAEAVAGRAYVLLGTGTNDTRTTVELTRQARDYGADGVMMVTPYYNRPPQAGLEEHFQRAAAATGLPVMLYNVPGRTGVNLLPATVQRLAAAVPNLVAVKEASGNLDQVSELCRLTAGRLSVYSGDDSLTLPMMAVGAVGVVSVASHVVGPRVKEMTTAFTRGEVERARRLHHELFPLFKALFVTTNPIPVKAALRRRGFGGGEVRPPLCSAGPEEEKTLEAALRALGLVP